MQSYSNTDEMEIESRYLTSLQMPKFEKRFRKEIIRPLTNLVHKSFSDQAKILTDLRYKLHYIQQGVYLDCKDVFLESEAIDDEHKNKIRTDHSFTIPSIDLEERIYEVSDEASDADFLDEIRFVDPEALGVVKNKLLPQVIKNLLSLDCKDGNVAEFICPLAEGIVAGILLDFVRFISEVLNVANQAMKGLQDHHRYSNNDDTEQSRKRSRNEMGYNKTCPNILNILGENLLDVVAKLLAVDSCFAGHIQSMRKIKGEEMQHDLPQDDIIQRNLPIFYKSTSTKEREKWNDEHCNDNERFVCCPITTGEWVLYYKLYYPASDVTELVKQALVPTFTKHMVAIVFSFIQGSCVRNLVKCVESYLEQSNKNIAKVERIDCTVFKPTMQIMQSLSYLSSYISEKIDPENLGVFSAVCNDLEKFRHASLEYITSIKVGVDVSTPEHCRSIMETLNILDDRNSGVESRSNGGDDEFLLKIVIDFSQDDVDKLRTEIIWRLLTGKNTHQSNDEQSTPPPIQCQLFGLNELRSWLQSMETQMLQYETEYEKLLNGAASDQLNSSQLDSKSPLGSRERMVQSPTQKELHSDCIMIVDEGSGSKHTKDSKAVHIEKIINLSQVQNENDVILLDNESTEARCNSKTSISSNDEQASKFAKRQKLDDSNHLEDESTVISSSHQLTVGRLLDQMRLRFVKVLDVITSEKYNVLDILMSKNVHRELLKRVFPVLQLLTEYSRLNSNHILLLWNLSGFTKDASESLHVSVTSIILDVLIDLLNFNNWRGASKHAFSYLNSLFMSVEKDIAWNFQKLKFLDAMVRRSVDILVEDNSGTGVIPGCMHSLWDLSNHSNCLNCTSEICYQAYLHLFRLFEWIFSRKAADMGHSFLSLRSNITKMIIASMKCDTEHHRYPSANLLFLILNRLEFRESGLSNDSSDLICIDDVCESFDLTAIVIREMVSFSNIVRKTRQEESAHLFDDSLKGVEIRVNLLKELIRVLISLQKKAHNTISSGRKRSRDDNHNGDNSLDSISRNINPITDFPDLEQIKILWDSFVKGCDGLESSDLILNTFHILLSSRSLVGKCSKFDTWRKDAEKTLFPLCRSIHPSSMTLSAYRLLIYCIGNINAMEGKYEIRPFEKRTCSDFEHSQILLGNSLGNESSDNLIGETSDVYYVSNVNDHDIEGIDLLWKLVLEGNDEVADLAMAYLSILYTFTCNEGTRKVKQQDLIDHCFSILSQEYKDLSSIHHVKRILCLVTLFVKSVYRSSGLKIGEVLDLVSHGRSGDDLHKVQVDSILGINSPFNVVLKGIKGEVNTVQCPYGARTTLGYIRKIAAKLRKFPAIRLIFAGRELKDDNAPMSSLGITEGSSIVYIPFVTVTHEFKETNDGVHAIHEEVRKSNDDSKKSLIYDSTRYLDYRSLQSKFLTVHGVEQFAANEKLELIFSLFSMREDSKVNSRNFLYSQIWELLQLLPTNSDLERNIAKIFSGNTKISWPNILPIPSTCLEEHKLLYNLQALERSFLKIEKGEGKEQLQEAAIIEDESTLSHVHGVNAGQIPSSSNAVVILDDDDIMKTYDTVPAANVMKSISLCEVMKFGGGIEHLLGLLESINLNFSNFDENTFDQCVVRLLSVHKIVFLLSFLLYQEVDQSKLDDIVISNLSNRGSLFSIITKLIEVINATLTFQNSYSGNSTSLLWSYSLFDISSALVVRCFSMTRAMILSSIKTCSYFLCTYCANIATSVSARIMCDLIQLVLFHTNTEKLCSSGHSLLMDIFLLHENSDRIAFTKELSSNGYIRSNVLSLFIVVFEEEHMKVENMNSKQFQAFFGLFQTSITLMWSEMDFNEKDALTLDLQTKLKKFSIPPASANFEKLSQQCGVASFFELCIWTINSCFRLATHNNALECELSLASFLQLLSHLLATIEDRKVKELIASIGTPSGLLFIDALLQKVVPFSDTDDTTPVTLSFNTVTEIGNTAKILCQDCESNQSHFINFFNRLFLQESPRQDLVDSWNYDPALLEKNNEIHLVGLKNQGATCYMNSLLQQLFFIPKFRDSILFGLEENILCSNDNDDSNEETKKMLIEIRNLFGSLYLSDHKYYDTADLVATIKGYDGNYIRPGEQQDVDEFFNLFSDRLETALNGTSQSRLLHEVFGGKLSHLIKCKECGYCSERTEDYLSISLDVKGKNNMTESLRSYIRGDLLDGSNQYFCSKCNEKRDSVKRCCIKDLPETLICHLKRFEFDLESLRKVKVNDRFEYPLELHLREYTVEGIDEIRQELNQPERDESYYNYKLRGVLVHMGTAESGHYYSICSVRDVDTGVASNISKCTNDEWYRCNDSNVTKFDPNTLAEATFGGISTNTTASFHQKRNFSPSEKNYSAYLLIYDRVKIPGLQTKRPSTFLSEGSNQGTKPDLSWAKEIWDSNNRNRFDKILFSSNFRNLLDDICLRRKQKTSSTSFTMASMEGIQALTLYSFDYVIHSCLKDCEIKELFSRLSSLFEVDISACTWFVSILSKSHQFWLEKVFFKCTSETIRTCFVKFLSLIFKVTIPEQRDHYYEIEVDTNREGENDCFDCDDDVIYHSLGPSTSPTRLGRFCYWNSKVDLVQCVGYLMDLILAPRYGMKIFDQLFEIIYLFALNGVEESLLLVRSGMILKLTHVLLGEDSTIPSSSIMLSPSSNQKFNSHKSLSAKCKKTNLNSLKALISHLSRHANIALDDGSDISDSDSDSNSDNESERNRSLKKLKLGPGCEKSPYLTMDQNEAKTSIQVLPVRDSRALCRKDVLELMMTSNKSESLDLKNNITQYMIHICFNNIDMSRLVCEVAETIVRDKKYYQAEIALDTLLSLIHIDDMFTEQRVAFVFKSIMAVIQENIDFEKESSCILNSIFVELTARTGKKAQYGLIEFYNHIVEHFEHLASMFKPHETPKGIARSYGALLHALVSIDCEKKIDFKSSDDVIRLRYGGRSVHCLSKVQEKIEFSKHLPQGKLIPFSNIESLKDAVFEDLVKRINSLQKHLKRDDNKILQEKSNKEEIDAIVESSSFSDYFSALRCCLKCPRGKIRVDTKSKMIESVVKEVLDIFWKVDDAVRSSKRYHADILKGEIVLLLDELLIVDPRQTVAVLEEKPSIDDTFTQMLEVYVTTSTSAEYNNTYTMNFYKFLIDLGKYSHSFLKSLLNHNNWLWSIGAFVLNQDISSQTPLYEILLKGTTGFIQLYSDFRQKVYKRVLETSHLFSQDSPDRGTLELLVSIFDSELKSSIILNDFQAVCVDNFVSSEVGGLSKLSTSLNHSFERWRNCQGKEENEHMTLVSLCLEALITINQLLGHSHFLSPLKSTNFWPEVEGVTLLLPQIVAFLSSKDPSHEETSIKIIEKIESLQNILRDEK